MFQQASRYSRAKVFLCMRTPFEDKRKNHVWMPFYFSPDLDDGLPSWIDCAFWGWLARQDLLGLLD